MSMSLASKYMCGQKSSKKTPLTSIACGGDVLAASVINQKAVNQNTQQIMVLIALQLADVIEAQFGFSTNDDSDVINA